MTTFHGLILPNDEIGDIQVDTTQFGHERKQYKQLISRQFSVLLSSERIKRMIKNLSFADYEFLIANDQHVEPLLDLLSNEYVKSNPQVILLSMSKVEVRALFAVMIKYKVDGGRCFIIMNKTKNTLIGCTCMADYYDSGSNYKSQLTPEATHAFEMITSIQYHDKLKKLTQNKYGVLFHHTNVCKNSNIKSPPFLLMFLNCLATSTMINCNYKYWYGETTHRETIRASSILKPIILFELDYSSSYTFNDGTHISDYFNKLKANNDDKMIEQLRQNCKLQIMLCEKDKQFKILQNIFEIIGGNDRHQMKKQKLSKL